MGGVDLSPFSILKEEGDFSSEGVGAYHQNNFETSEPIRSKIVEDNHFGTPVSEILRHSVTFHLRLYLILLNVIIHLPC